MFSSEVDKEKWTVAIEPDAEALQKAEDTKKHNEELAQGSIFYGPERPLETARVGYRLFSNKNYLKGYSNKILYDLKLVASMYNGHEVKVYVVDKSERCPKCTNLVTGEKLISNCPVCHGTGYKNNWKCIGDYWSYMDFGPDYKMATQYGNTESPNGTKESLILLGAPILIDQAIVIFIESKEVYKVYDVEPHMVAMRGDVIAQIAQCSRLTPGAEEYKLINW